MTDYKFTQDWFGWAPPVWEKLVPLLPEGDTYGVADYGQRTFLEIGSFEGRSTVWIIENMMRPGDWIDCVDTWAGGEEHTNGEMAGAEARFIHNIGVALGGAEVRYPEEFSSSRHVRYTSPAPTEGQRKKVYKYKATSTAMLGQKIHFQMDCFSPEHVPLYGFIYIDGSHIARDVLTDACMAWPLLQKGGIMVFDDYLWGEPRDILHRPKPAIDAFTNLFAEELNIIHVGYQLVIQKK